MADLIVRATPADCNVLHGGFDAQTEVLTERGWTPWAKYGGGSVIATVRPTDGALQFQEPVALSAREYDGAVISARHRALNFVVTPDLPLYVRRWNEGLRTLDGEFGFVQAGRIGWYAGLMHAPSHHIGVKVARMTIGRFAMSGEDFLALLAVIVSDGYVASTDNNRDRIGFCCFNPRRRPMVAALAARLGFTEQASRPGVWYAPDPALAAWLRRNIYSGGEIGALSKRLPRLVMAAPREQIEHFLAFFGDKHCRDGNRTFYSSSKLLIDDLQELLLRLGRRSTICEAKLKDTQMRDGRFIAASSCATPYVLVERQANRLSVERKSHVTEERYRGMIFSVTTWNPLIVTRREGRVLISGSSSALPV